MRAVDLTTVVVFLNSRDERRFGEHAEKADRDKLATAADYKRWLVARELLSPRVPVTAADAEEARALRDALRALVSREPGAERSLTALAQRFPLLVSFAPDPRLSAQARGVREVLAAVLATCAIAAVEGQWARVKMCAADDCRFVFFDRGRNRLGRWCAMEACGNRMKTRSFRARRRVTRERSSRGAA